MVPVVRSTYSTIVPAESTFMPHVSFGLNNDK
jgi:hypothetical protein